MRYQRRLSAARNLRSRPAFSCKFGRSSFLPSQASHVINLLARRSLINRTAKTKFPFLLKHIPPKMVQKNTPARSSSHILQIPTVTWSIHNKRAASDKVSLRASSKNTQNSSRFCCTPLYTAFMYYLFVISPLFIVFLQYYA